MASTKANAGTLSPIKASFNKIGKRLRLFDRRDWIAFSLWIGTLATMFIFIGVAASDKSDAVVYANGVAAAGTVFMVFLFAAILVTVIFKYLQKRREGGA